MRRVLRCYAEGRDGAWEAICLDLDIAVQENSFEGAFHALNEAIALHLDRNIETLRFPASEAYYPSMKR